MKAIETYYNGYRFRSRLEARWAVVFDTLGIRYEYEPEGFETSAGPYLPDFRFDMSSDERYELWAEVKGAPITEHEMRRIQAFAFNEPGRFVLALGALPAPPGRGSWAAWGHTPEGPAATTWQLTAAGWKFEDWWGSPLRDTLPLFSGHFRRSSEPTYLPPVSRVAAALDAGRTARFEHGESGAQR